MKKDRDVDVVPSLAMNLVVGGEENVFAADRNVARVLEVAAFAFGPVAAQNSRCNRDLILVRSYDRLERRSHACRQTWIDIFRSREGHLTLKAVRASVRCTGQLAGR